MSIWRMDWGLSGLHATWEVENTACVWEADGKKGRRTAVWLVAALLF